MSNLRKYFAEFIGTAVLVILGCGTAMVTDCKEWGGYVATALAFGLVIVGMAYCVGNVSGCHINPAVSLGVLLSGGMTFGDFIGYVLAQCIGATAGAGVLAAFKFGGMKDLTDSFGSNTVGNLKNAWIGILVEAVLTFIFVLVILGVTSKKENGSVAGLVIGFTLTLVHLLGIRLTGTSVNPARSFGPALMTCICNKDGGPIGVLWVFVVGPFVGAALAALVHKCFTCKKCEE